MTAARIAGLDYAVEMPNRWSERYSPSEMMYLEIDGDRVKCYLHHSPGSADVWTFAEVLVGAVRRAEAGAVFGNDVMNELEAEVRTRTKGPT